MLNSVALVTTEPEHWGSAVSPPIASTVNGTNFVLIEGVPIMDVDNTIDTPSHMYAVGPPPLFHSHDGQVVDYNQQNYVTVEGKIVIVEGDKNISNDTRIVSAGQSFVKVE